MSLERTFAQLGTKAAPGQEVRLASGRQDWMTGDRLEGRPVDFSHGDVDAHPPAPGAADAFLEGLAIGGAQAYTEYRGDAAIREGLAAYLAEFTGAPVDARDGLIVTPGTQGALFLAVASVVESGDKVAIVDPDYFANRKIVTFLGAEVMPVPLVLMDQEDRAGLDFKALEAAFEDGAKVFLFSNPNNPAGVVYSAEEISRIAELAHRYGVFVIVDQLYSRLRYSGCSYTHLRAQPGPMPEMLTIMGPSKTESLSGYRLGVAFGSQLTIDRMEKLQAVVSLRAAGYSQAVLRSWFREPEGWMEGRIADHQAIRDALVAKFREIEGCQVRQPWAGSYLFPGLPELRISTAEFVTALRVQAGVTVTPGGEFGSLYAHHIRLNFSQARAAAVDAVTRIAALVERYRA